MSKLKFNTLEEATEFAEKKVSELTEVNKELAAKTSDLKRAEAQIQNLESLQNEFKTKDSAHNTEVDSLNATISDLKTNLQSAVKDRDDALAEVETLSKKLDLSEKHGADGLMVTIKGKNFTLSGNRFFTPDGEMNAEELSKNTKELERMVKIKSGSLIPLD